MPTTTTTSSPTTTTASPYKLQWPIVNVAALLTNVGFKDPAWHGNPNHTYPGHTGTDIGYIALGSYWSPNTQVVAAAAGTVLRTWDGEPSQCNGSNWATANQCGRGCRSFINPGGVLGGNCGGNFVVIDHGAAAMADVGYRYTSYAHLEMGSVAVSPGEVVSKGQIVGMVGSSGNSTGPHLHFEAGTGPGYNGFTSGWVEPFNVNPDDSLWEDQCLIANGYGVAALFNSDCSGYGGCPVPIWNCEETTTTPAPTSCGEGTIAVTHGATTTTTTTPAPSVNPHAGQLPFSDCTVIDLTNASVMGVSSRGQFVGEGTVKYRTVESIDLEGFIDVRATNNDLQGVKQVQQAITDQLVDAVASCSAVIRPIKVNGVSLGRGKLISFDYQASENTLNNQIMVGSWSASVEILKSVGDFSKALDSGNLSGGIAIIESISENFSVSLSDNDTYTFNHSLDVQLVNDQPSTDPWPQEAKDLCTSVFKERYDSSITSFNLIIGSHYGDYNSTARELHKEEYDLYKGSFSFSRSFTLNKESQTDYSIVRTHGYSQDQNGIVKVVENGEIIAKTTQVENYETWVNQEVSNSYTRCLVVFNAYFGNFSGGLDIGDTRRKTDPSYTLCEYTLHEKPITVTKKLNFGEAEVSYTVEYTNDVGIWAGDGDYYLDRTISLAQGSGGILQVTEQGSLSYNEIKNTSFQPEVKIASIRGDASLIKERCEKALESYHLGNGENWHHREGALHTLYLTKTNFSFDRFGKKISYSYTYSDSKEFQPKVGGLVSKSSIKEIDKLATDKFTSYVIPNAGDEIMHYPDGRAMKNMAQRTIVVTYTLRRQDANIFHGSYNISNILETARQTAIKELHKVYSDNSISAIDYNDIHITAANYTFNSSRVLTVSMTADIPIISYGPNFAQADVEFDLGSEGGD